MNSNKNEEIKENQNLDIFKLSIQGLKAFKEVKLSDAVHFRGKTIRNVLSHGLRYTILGGD